MLAVRSGMISTQRLYSRLTRALHSLTSGNRFGQIQGYFQDEDQKTNMLELISAAIEKVPNRTELSLTILEMWKSAAMPPVFIHGFEQSNSAGLLHEQCELCNAHILFETTAEASCQNGHQFSRYRCCHLYMLKVLISISTMRSHTANHSRAWHLEVLCYMQCPILPGRRASSQRTTTSQVYS